MKVKISSSLKRGAADTVTLFHDIVDEIVEYDDDIEDRTHLLHELSDAAFASRDVRRCFFKEPLFTKFLVTELIQAKLQMEGVTRLQEAKYVGAILQVLFRYSYNN